MDFLPRQLHQDNFFNNRFVLRVDRILGMSLDLIQLTKTFSFFTWKFVVGFLCVLILLYSLQPYKCHDKMLPRLENLDLSDLTGAKPVDITLLKQKTWKTKHSLTLTLTQAEKMIPVELTSSDDEVLNSSKETIGRKLLFFSSCLFFHKGQKVLLNWGNFFYHFKNKLHLKQS